MYSKSLAFNLEAFGAMRDQIWYLKYKYENISNCLIRFTSEDTIEEGIHNIAQEKLKLEQDVTGEGEGESKTKKKDISRLLKVGHKLF